MKKTLFNILCLLFLWQSCTNGKTKQEDGQDSILAVPKDSLLSPKQVKRDTVPYPSSDSCFYVTAQKGISYWNTPDTSGSPLGVFEYGTKLAVVDDSLSRLEKGALLGDWVKVKSKINKEVAEKYAERLPFRFSGYVSTHRLVPESKMEISKIPIYRTDSVHFNSSEDEEELQLTFAKITANQFKAYKKDYHPNIEVDSSKLFKEGEGGSSFIQTSKNIIKLHCPRDFNRCSYYHGFLPKLHLYITSFTGAGVAQIELIDSVSNITHITPGDFDGGCSIPLPSKNDSQLLVYATDMFSRASLIGIYATDSTSKRLQFDQYKGFHTEEWRIDDLIWINEKSFALKIYDEDVQDKDGKTVLSNIRYLRAAIK